MSTLSPVEATAAITAHHAELHAGLRDRVAALEADARRSPSVAAGRTAVVGYLDTEILPHARAEEDTLYRAGDAGPAAPLVDAMRAEHRDLAARVERLRSVADPIEAVAGAAAILALFESHLAKENDRLIPALLAQPGVSLGELLSGMHELVG